MSESHTHGLLERADLSPAFRWAVALNAGYVVIELIAGLATGSLALLADAAHNLTDVAGLLIAWGRPSWQPAPRHRGSPTGSGKRPSWLHSPTRLQS